MKKLMNIITVLLFILISSCVPEDETETDGDITGDGDPNEVVTFPDPGLEKCVRKAIVKPEGDILIEDLKYAYSLKYCEGFEIRDLTGIEKITVLQSFQAGNNKIKDITPLSKCVNLRELNLSDNEIEDASPLGSLVNLTSLNIVSNAISDISYVSNLSELVKFHTSDNPVSNISAVSNLTNLTGLDFYKNEIESISDIKGLINLIGISVGDNCITDFSAIDYLKENGKLVNILGDSVSDQDYDRCK